MSEVTEKQWYEIGSVVEIVDGFGHFKNGMRGEVISYPTYYDIGRPEDKVIVNVKLTGEGPEKGTVLQWYQSRFCAPPVTKESVRGFTGQVLSESFMVYLDELVEKKIAEALANATLTINSTKEEG